MKVIIHWECELNDFLSKDEDFDIEFDVENLENFDRLRPRKSCSGGESCIYEFKWIADEHEDETLLFLDINKR